MARDKRHGGSSEMKNRPLRKAILLQLLNIVGDVSDTNEAVLKLITELARHYSNAIKCHDKLEKYEQNKIIRILKKLKVIRI
jgi:hypothetical protein